MNPVAGHATAAQAGTGLGLGARIVFWSLVLLLAVQAAVLVVVRINIESSARSQIQVELQVFERIWLRLLETNAARLRLGAGVLASDFGFRAAVNSGDAETVRSALENHGARIGATVTALLDPVHTVRALADGPDQQALHATLARVAVALAARPESSQVALVAGQAVQFVMVPMRAPVLVGWVVMGFPIDQALVDEMKSLSNGNVVLLGRAGAAAPMSIVATLPADRAEQWARVDPSIGELVVGGERFVARSVALPSTQGDISTWLILSLDDLMAPFSRVQILLVVITALGVALFALGSALTARWVTTPLRSLVQATVRLGRGDYGTPMAQVDRRDEIGDLSLAFEHMRSNIAAQQHEIRQLAYWDSLTGLPNRARFRVVLAQAIDTERRTGGSLAIVLLDLDRFKHVNDILGYALGDRLLKAVAARLVEQTRHMPDRRHGARDGVATRRAASVAEPGGPAREDLVARMGGDEFAVLLTGSDGANAAEMAQRIVKAFESPLSFDDQTVDLGAGIGIACWPADADNADALLNRAEIAMYAAKRKAVGVLFYEPGLDFASPQTLSMLTELRHALEHGELRLYLQPKIAVGSGHVVGAEALVRWQHASRGLVSPASFIPFAEQTGFIHHLTLWVIDAAARCWDAIQPPGLQLKVSVNLSARDLLAPDLPSKLEAIMARHQVAASNFCLEITESAIIDEPQRAEATLNRLSAAGFRLSIDDYGTGYSSLAYIRRLPVDELKIDKSFVIGMEQNPDDETIVQSTIELAHRLGLTVVAEGLENRELLLMLRRMGCDEGQGYYMSKPMPAYAFNEWREDWMEHSTQVMDLA